MTKKKLSPLSDALDVDHQSSLILAAFSEYLEADADRAIVLSRRPVRSRGGWSVELVEKRRASGTTLRDATAQIATALRLEADEGK